MIEDLSLRSEKDLSDVEKELIKTHQNKIAKSINKINKICAKAAFMYALGIVESIIKQRITNKQEAVDIINSHLKQVFSTHQNAEPEER